MQEGLGGLAEGDITWIGWYDNTHSVADKWETAMAKAGTKGTDYSFSWFYENKGYSDSYFRVRPVLAF